MRYVNYLLVTAAFAVLSFPTLSGESVAHIEAELLRQRKEVEKWSAYGDAYDGEKLEAANAAFLAAMLKHTASPETLKHPFKTLAESVGITTSSDGKLRVYSWDTLSGGTMFFYRRVYQFESADGKVHSKADELGEGDPGRYVDGIHTVTTSASGNVYLVSGVSHASSKLRGQYMNLLRVDGSDLKPANLFKTRSGMTDSISFAYDCFSLGERPQPRNPLVAFDEKTNTLKFPVVIVADEFPDGKVTDRFIRYRFNGKQFVKLK